MAENGKRKPRETTTYEVDVGDTCRDYQGGNYINAIDDVTCFFLGATPLTEIKICDLLRAYIENLKER